MNSTHDHIIIGGGMAGLCLAYHLVQHQKNVVLIEKQTLGCAASRIAAGMITPASEVHLHEPDLMQLFLTCTAYYPEFISKLTNNNPTKVDFAQNGSLMCAIDQDGIADLKRLHDFQTELGLDISFVNPEDLTTLEPALSHRVVAASYAKTEAHVDPRQLMSCLKEKLLQSKQCTILEHQNELKILIQENIAHGVSLKDGELFASSITSTTGLSLLPELTNNNFKLRPVKGQVLTVQAPRQVLSRPIRVYHRYPIYLVPRRDGRIVIGATSEELTDTNVTAGGVMDLAYAAWQVLPDLFDYPIVETTAGLRPATHDNKPIVGATHIKNLTVLTGLYRHGIMAAPYLAKALAESLVNQHELLAVKSLENFSPQRFAA